MNTRESTIREMRYLADRYEKKAAFMPLLAMPLLFVASIIIVPWLGETVWVGWRFLGGLIAATGLIFLVTTLIFVIKSVVLTMRADEIEHEAEISYKQLLQKIQQQERK